MDHGSHKVAQNPGSATEGVDFERATKRLSVVKSYRINMMSGILWPRIFFFRSNSLITKTAGPLAIR